MHIFFDVDYTILSSDQRLRKGTHEVFERLVNDGHRVYLWSGTGERWDVVHRFALESYLSGVFAKPLSHYNEELVRLRVPVAPDFVIDDFPDIVRYFGGYHITDFADNEFEMVYGFGGYHDIADADFVTNSDDNELEMVYGVITEVGATGWSDHASWFPGTHTSPTSPVEGVPEDRPLGRQQHAGEMGVSLERG